MVPGSNTMQKLLDLRVSTAGADASAVVYKCAGGIFVALGSAPRWPLPVSASRASRASLVAALRPRATATVCVAARSGAPPHGGVRARARAPCCNQERSIACTGLTHLEMRIRPGSEDLSNLALPLRYFYYLTPRWYALFVGEAVAVGGSAPRGRAPLSAYITWCEALLPGLRGKGG